MAMAGVLQHLLLALLGPISTVIASGTVSLPLEKRALIDGTQIPSKGVYRRQVSDNGTSETTVYDVLPWSTGGAYYTNITVGTPPQTLTVILDTGSSDLYVDASSSQACRDTQAQNTCRGGSFDPSTSTTYAVAQRGGFETQFGDGSTASGDFGKDTVGIGDILISNVQLGVASTVNSTTGFAVSLMGVGYSTNEASATLYPNMPEVLQQAGAINSRLYSVFLNQLGDATGTILFGGIDTGKYTGQLQTLNILPTAIKDPQTRRTVNVVFQFVLAITGLSAKASGKTTTILTNGDPTGQDTTRSLPVLLDTGSAAWTVPTSVYTKVAALFGNAIQRDGSIDCSHQNDDVTLSIEFGSKITITVPAKSLIVPIYDPSTNQPYPSSSRGGQLCVFMLTPDSGGQQMSQQGFLTLGDAVLRSMYVVFDLDNGQLSLAQSNPGASTDATSSGSGNNIKVVQAGPSGVAKAVGSANSGVATVAANSYSIVPQVTATQKLSLATAASAVGTATGVDAIPNNGRVAATSGSTTGSGSSTSSSSGAASALAIPPFDKAAVVVFAVWLGMACIGIARIV